MKKPILLFLAIFAFAMNSFSQDNVWRKANNSTISAESKLSRDTKLKDFSLYKMDLNAIKTELLASPKRSEKAVSNVIVSFPNSQGELQRFEMYEASTLESIIAAQHPEIQTYVGKCLEDPTATITVTNTLWGLHAIIHSGRNGTDYIDPYTKDLATYVVYNKTQTENTNRKSCGSIDKTITEVPESETLLRSSNSVFKTYRLAMACTIQYATYHINAAGLSNGTIAQKKAAVLAAMVVTVARVNSVYERDFALTMVLINNNLDIINVEASPLDANNSNGLALLNQMQAYVDGIITFANYDIGHVASTGGGGVAILGCVCTTSKAEGVTGLTAPVGDNYDIDYVAHEMGHQFGGDHTFNSLAGNCGGSPNPNRSGASAFEPGSGTTIQAYAGICAPDNVQPHSDAYFHARSLLQMTAQINGIGTNCAASQPNGNTPPVVYNNGDLTSSNCSIPSGTAFKLTGSATDIDNPSGNQLTYCWEHYNLAPVSVPLSPTNISGPNFRSFSPTTSPERYFPKLATVVANSLTTTWEVVPTVARVMTFSLVVRDNGGPLGGQTQRVIKTVTLVGTTPFKVTSQSAVEGWAQNSSQTVTWDVAGSDVAPINTPKVNIRLSTDGGLTFPIFLATNVPNDGSETVTAPNVVSQTCRIMVEGAGNVFYALNKTNFYIGYSIVNSCSTYKSNTTLDNVTPFNVTDGATAYIQKKIVVPTTTNLISDVNITINATHPDIQNLQVAYLRPSGGLTSLFSSLCPGSANMNVVFDSQGAPFTCGSPIAPITPTAGTYAPVISLNSLNGLNPSGTWSFGFRDTVAGNAGSIDSFSLEICSQTITLLASDSFNFENFSIFPNPNNGNFNVRFDSGLNSKISISVNDLQGRKVFEKNYTNSGLFSENLQLDNTQKGIYLVIIKDGEKQIVKKIVIE